MYLGTAGVSYALMRVCQTNSVLPTEAGESRAQVEENAEEQKETTKPEEGKLTTEVICANFLASHDLNMKLVKKDSSGKHENNCASFFMAASIGNYTIDTLKAIAKVVKSTSDSDEDRLAVADQVKKICNSVKQNILFAAAHCIDDVNEPEDEILYGSAGFLQTILLLKNELKKLERVVERSVEPKAKLADLMTRMDFTIRDITVKLYQQVMKVPEDS